MLKDYLPYLNKQKRKIADLKALVERNGAELQSTQHDIAVPSIVLDSDLEATETNQE